MMLSSSKIKIYSVTELTSILGVHRVEDIGMYLSVPIKDTRLKKEDTEMMNERINIRLDAWKLKVFSFAGRCTLIKAVL